MNIFNSIPFTSLIGVLELDIKHMNTAPTFILNKQLECKNIIKALVNKDKTQIYETKSQNNIVNNLSNRIEKHKSEHKPLIIVIKDFFDLPEKQRMDIYQIIYKNGDIKFIMLSNVMANIGKGETSILLKGHTYRTESTEQYTLLTKVVSNGRILGFSLINGAGEIEDLNLSRIMLLAKSGILNDCKIGIRDGQEMLVISKEAMSKIKVISI